MFGFLEPAVDSDLPLGRTGLVLERQRKFVRKTVTLTLAIVILAPLIWWKSALGATIYLGALVVIHVFALAVFLHRIDWRSLSANKWGLTVRVVGLLTFGVLLGMLRYDPASDLFWVSLTLLWGYHVASLALLHVRHRVERAALEKDGAAECPIPWPASVREPAKPK